MNDDLTHIIAQAICCGSAGMCLSKSSSCNAAAFTPEAERVRAALKSVPREALFAYLDFDAGDEDGDHSADHR